MTPAASPRSISSWRNDEPLRRRLSAGPRPSSAIHLAAPLDLPHILARGDCTWPPKPDSARPIAQPQAAKAKCAKSSGAPPSGRRGRCLSWRRSSAAYYCALDKSTPLRAKAILLAALGYFVLPADTIPDIVLGLGFTDDIAVLTAAITAVRAHMTPAHRLAAKRALAGRLRRRLCAGNRRCKSQTVAAFLLFNAIKGQVCVSLLKPAPDGGGRSLLLVLFTGVHHLVTQIKSK